MSRRELDVIIWGATGFTGGLVVEYLAKTYGAEQGLRWAIAGRNRQKLEKVRQAILPGAGEEQLPILLGDSEDTASLANLAAKTRVICSTVGPYAVFGEPLIKACAEAGTDYCDLCGESFWVAKMISSYQDVAVANGARIVCASGFDSVPSDMGTWFLQQAMLEKCGEPARHVKARIGNLRGSYSGGTWSTMINTVEEARRDSSVRKLLEDPYSLYPKGAEPGKDGRDQVMARFDKDFDQWTYPFPLAPMNARVVRRSNAVMGYPWGKEFQYDESALEQSRLKATGTALGFGAFMTSMAIGPVRRLAKKFLPASGQGPSREEREAGFYEIFFHGIHPKDRNLDLRAKVSGDMDPGYGSTAKILGEAAVCLALDERRVEGGLWTPSSAMDGSLLVRLTEKAGLTFEILDNW
jgi:short subunit dehydrogenase-like uncharacterized protein